MANHHQSPPPRVLLVGANGFVGRHLQPELHRHGYALRLTSRNRTKVMLENSANHHPADDWVHLDVNDARSVDAAMAGCDAAVYLVHQVGASDDYAIREEEAAKRFAESARRCGVGRVVYLGGVVPQVNESRHLRSRRRTGELLRSSGVPTVELRAGMIIGRGGASWEMVRDLADRLPAMLLPDWLRYHSWPVAIEDVVFAIRSCLDPKVRHGCYEIPGPERISHQQLLRLTARQLGKNPPIMLNVPGLSPVLSSYWIGLITSARQALAKELVMGLLSDLDPTGDLLWTQLAHHRLVPLDAAIQRATLAPSTTIGSDPIATPWQGGLN